MKPGSLSFFSTAAPEGKLATFGGRFLWRHSVGWRAGERISPGGPNGPSSSGLLSLTLTTVDLNVDRADGQHPLYLLS